VPTICDRMKAKQQQEEPEWLAEHAPHGEPQKSYPKAQPRSYKIYRLTCPCGRRIVGIEDPAEKSKSC
jgi:hypothetical protein